MVRGIYHAESALGPDYPSVPNMFLVQPFRTPAEAVSLVRTFLGENPSVETDDEEEQELENFIE